MQLYRIGTGAFNGPYICPRIVAADNKNEAYDLYHKLLYEERNKDSVAKEAIDRIKNKNHIAFANIIEEIPEILNTTEKSKIPLGSRLYSSIYKSEDTEVLFLKPPFPGRAALIERGKQFMLSLDHLEMEKQYVKTSENKSEKGIDIDFYRVLSDDENVHHFHTTKKDFFYMLGLMSSKENAESSHVPVEYANLITWRASQQLEHVMRNFVKNKLYIKPGRNPDFSKYISNLTIFSREYNSYLFDKLYYEFILGKEMNF